jgi:hypothetical protein
MKVPFVELRKGSLGWREPVVNGEGPKGIWSKAKSIKSHICAQCFIFQLVPWSSELGVSKCFQEEKEFSLAC